jgi:hypothetical protein
MTSRRWLRRLAVIPAALLVGLLAGGTLGFVVQGDDPRSTDRTGLAPGRESGVEEPPHVEPIASETLLAWTPGGLPAGFGERVMALEGVEEAVAVVSGTAWMSRSMTEDGAVIDQPPASLGVPLEVAAAHLPTYAHFLAPGERALLPRLAAGGAVLGATSADVRRMTVGDLVAFGDVQVRVVGIVPDAAIGAHEVFVSKPTAARLGLTRERYLLIDPGDGASRERLTTRLGNLLPPGILMRVRGPGETPYFRHGDAVLPPVHLKEVFGEFAARPIDGGYLQPDPAWVDASIARVSVPILGPVTCNRALIPQLRGALLELVAEGLSRLVDPGGFGGCYSARFINRNPDTGISHHSWGVAVDINVPENRFGQTPHQDPRLVAIFERWGFTWGGRWILPDGMHFEFVEFASGN